MRPGSGTVSANPLWSSEAGLAFRVSPSWGKGAGLCAPMLASNSVCGERAQERGVSQGSSL